MRKRYFIVVLILGFCFLGQTKAAKAQKTDQIKTADDLFQAGKFAEAGAGYKAVVLDNPNSFQAFRRLGEIALFGNQLKVAQKWLKKALLINPNDRQANALLAEALYRQDDFQKAAPLLRFLGRESAAQALESFKDIQPYQIEGKSQFTSLKCVSTDPLPVIRVRVNDTEEVNFIIDTGGAEVIIDPELANRVKALQFGSETGTFAGGKQAALQHGRIDSITLGEFKIRNVPVQILNTRQFSAAAQGNRVDGVLGTVMLYHFLSTLDYPNGQLILRRKTTGHLKRLTQAARSGTEIIVPFWMAGDHYVVAWGSINNSQPFLFFVDTGLAGAGFTCPDSTVKEAGIKLPEGGNSGEGVGGGGKVRAVPFKADDLSFGEAREKNIIAIAGVFPPKLENTFGFRIAGLISHQFFRPYALTIDFTGMKILLERKNI